MEVSMKLQFLQLAVKMKLEMFEEMIEFESQFDEEYDKGRVSALKFVVSALEVEVNEPSENVKATIWAG
jgi:hypothetical protein